MTLVLAATSPESIWLLVDRRLLVEGRPLKDDACKAMFLECTDGLAILGYAGLGATALGTEPSDWMSGVLRGRNLPLEQSLGVLAEAVRAQLPRHMMQVSGVCEASHSIVVPAFVRDEPRIYTIDIVLDPGRKRYRSRFTRHVVHDGTSANVRTPRFAAAGTGGRYLLRDRRWMRPLLRLVKACDRSRISAIAIAKEFARLNNEAHLGIRDNSVGPRCIVAWRDRKSGKGGSAHRFFTAEAQDPSSLPIPTIGNGSDIRALLQVIRPHFERMFADMRAHRPAHEFDRDQINAELAQMPDDPDETLR